MPLTAPAVLFVAAASCTVLGIRSDRTQLFGIKRGAGGVRGGIPMVIVAHRMPRLPGLQLRGGFTPSAPHTGDFLQKMVDLAPELPEELRNPDYERSARGRSTSPGNMPEPVARFARGGRWFRKPGEAVDSSSGDDLLGSDDEEDGSDVRRERAAYAAAIAHLLQRVHGGEDIGPQDLPGDLQSEFSTCLQNGQLHPVLRCAAWWEQPPFCFEIETPDRKRGKKGRGAIPMHSADSERVLTYNGGRCGGYAPGGFLWAQDRTEVVVSVFVPPDTRARDVAVDISASRVEISLFGRSLISQALSHNVLADDASLDGAWEVRAVGPRRAVQITLRKSSEGFDLSSTTEALPAPARDAACPLSTRGGTRLVRLVRGRVGGRGEVRSGARLRAHPGDELRPGLVVAL